MQILFNDNFVFFPAQFGNGDKLRSYYMMEVRLLIIPSFSLSFLSLSLFLPPPPQSA